MPEKTIAEALKLSSNKSLTLFNPPQNDDGLLEGLTQDISISDGDPADILLAFINDKKQLKQNILNLKSNIKQDGSLWIVWQKSKKEAGLSHDSIVQYAAAKNLRKESANDFNEKWEALQFKIDNA